MTVSVADRSRRKGVQCTDGWKEMKKKCNEGTWNVISPFPTHAAEMGFGSLVTAKEVPETARFKGCRRQRARPTADSSCASHHLAGALWHKLTLFTCPFGRAHVCILLFLIVISFFHNKRTSLICTLLYYLNSPSHYWLSQLVLSSRSTQKYL